MKRILLILMLLLCVFNTEANIDKKDLLCLTTTSYNEAKGEDLMGMMLIANVIINRSETEKVCKVAKQRNQFAYDVSTKIPKDLNDVLKNCIFDLYKGNYPIPKKLKEATHFHNNKVRPYWSKRLIYLGSYKNHRFYKSRDT